MSEFTPATSSESSPNRFFTTCWTQVAASHGDSSLAAKAKADTARKIVEKRQKKTIAVLKNVLKE